MTKYNLTTLLFILFTINTMANTQSVINRVEEPQYAIKKDYPHIIVPVNFGEAVLLSQAQLNTLDVNSVYQIDLVYTQFKRSQNFDQAGLNQARLSQLKDAAPDINRDAPIWNFISQTKAKDVHTAESFFHGFVIYYRPKGPELTVLKEKFRPYRANIEETYVIDNSTGGYYDYPSGTRVHIPAHAVVYANGDLVQGEYEIQYTEYRTQADIALSGIPMTFRETDQNVNFSSVGMYEITGSQADKPIQLQKAVTIDFNTTEIVDDAAFYQLNDESGDWEAIRPIDETEFGEAGNQEATNTFVEEVLAPEQNDFSWKTGTKKGIEFTVTQSPEFEEDFELILNQKAWANFTQLEETGEIDSIYQRMNPNTTAVYTQATNLDQLMRCIQKGKFVKKQKRHFAGKWALGELFLWETKDATVLDNGDRTRAVLIGGGKGADKGHTYPKMVRGLSTSKFGVYNCDQIYRIPNRQTIHPEFVDASTGEPIKNLGVACLMDLNYNGSFSFDPRYITYNPDGKNAILLTVGEDEFYIIHPEEFQKIDKTNKNPVLAMTNVTAQLKSTEDLTKLLGL